jgi:hypothetical protein
MAKSTTAAVISALLSATVAGSAFARDSVAKKPAMEGCRQLLQQAEDHKIGSNSAMEAARRACEVAAASNDAKSMKEASHGAAKALKQAKKDHDNLSKAFRRVGNEFDAPIGY